ncbi:ABC transporter permease [Nonomuraea turcica]|uniref:ABC transporter permease n=1 Tax=Nonomuraea sp. G32 TaxID=3067274 RepID=UPI00273C52CE|nr:ABC transporter permease [Nonomuraea sp. G32]MDP4502365.1 ABC transporter permease [Nonomuraea sp. G32]
MASATRELLGLHTRELLRDRRYFYFVLVFPFSMAGIFLTIAKLMPSGEGAPDFEQIVVPMALYLSVTGAALTMTAGPLAAMRAKGTLRLLGTTPITRARLVLTHVPARLAIVVVQTVLVLALALALGLLDLSAVPALLGITLLGLAMFGGIGYLIGGRMSSPDAATNVATLVQLAALFMSGLTLPLWLFPKAVGTALSLLPSSFYADLMATQLPGGRPFHPVWLSVLVVACTTGVVAWLAVKTFKWDQGEE